MGHFHLVNSICESGGMSALKSSQMVFTEDPSIRIRQIGGIRMDQMIRYIIYRFHFSQYRSVCVILLYSFLRMSRESKGKRERERERENQKEKEKEKEKERYEFFVLVAGKLSKCTSA